jgi:small-conductance mechanosensitive channel
MEFLGFTQLQWQEIGISLLIVAIAYLLGRWLIKRLVLPTFKKIISRTQTTLDDDLLDIAVGPAYWLLLIFAFQFALGRLDFLSDLYTFDLANIYFVGYFAIFFILAWQAISTVSSWYQGEISKTERTELGKQLMPFISRVALILLTLLGGIILLDHFNIEISGLVATLGIGSLAIALAAQAALADTISGFIIMIDRPYRIGDRIEILELDTWGDVTDIGLRSTRIRTRDNRMAVVPNSVISKSLVVNHSYPDDKYRLQIELGIAYGTNLERARKIMIQAVEKVEGVLTDRPVEALFLQFGESALMFRVRWWLDSYVDTRRMFDRVNTALYNALEEAGIEIPNPQRDVNFKINQKQRQNMIEVLREAK